MKAGEAALCLISCNPQESDQCNLSGQHSIVNPDEGHRQDYPEYVSMQELTEPLICPSETWQGKDAPSYLPFALYFTWVAQPWM